MRLHRRSVTRSFIFLFVSFTLLAGCSLGGGQTTAREQAEPAQTEPSPGTATVEPSRTPLATLIPTVDKTAKAAAEATQTAEANQEVVMGELSELGLGKPSGWLAYYDESALVVKVSDYMEDRIVPVSMDEYSDFILHTDVKWNSLTGFAGCGLVFRADQDLKNGPYYQLNLMRLQYAPGWDIEFWVFDEWAETLNPGGPEINKFIKDYNDSVNSVTLAVRGDEITTVINGHMMSTVKDDKLSRGLIGYMAFQESGETSCTFRNTWVWVLPGSDPGAST